MKSYGIEVPQEVLQAGLDAMQGEFTAMQIEGAIRRAGCDPKAIPSRVVDKLLRRERRAGSIFFSNGKWSKS